VEISLRKLSVGFEQEFLVIFDLIIKV